MTELTKAEQLADKLDLAAKGEHMIPFISSAAELRRLSPMEARVKELEDANKALQDVIKNWLPHDVDITDDRHWQWMEDTESLKALGENHV